MKSSASGMPTWDTIRSRCIHHMRTRQLHHWPCYLLLQRLALRLDEYRSYFPADSQSNFQGTDREHNGDIQWQHACKESWSPWPYEELEGSIRSPPKIQCEAQPHEVYFQSSFSQVSRISSHSVGNGGQPWPDIRNIGDEVPDHCQEGSDPEWSPCCPQLLT